MEDVNPRSKPTLRQEQAAVTRRRILEAARRRFYRDGYAATTLKAISLEAGVAVQTVYAVFGSKAAILGELRAIVVNLPEADRPFREALQESTPEVALRRFAHSIRRRWELAGDIVRINEDAVRVDPTLGPDVDEARRRRHGGLVALADALHARSGLPAEASRTVAMLDVLSMHEGYVELTAVHGWTGDEYERWLGDQLVGAILTMRA